MFQNTKYKQSMMRSEYKLFELAANLILMNH